MRTRQLFNAAILGLAAAFALPALADAGHGHGYDFGKPAEAAQATRTVEVTLGEMYFEPKSLQVKAGETVRFVIHNKGSLLHEFNLGNAALHAEHQKEMQQLQAMGMLTPTGMSHGMAGMDHASPPPTDAIRKMAMPARITGFRPYRSASLPNTTVMAVCASRNAEKTQL